VLSKTPVGSKQRTVEFLRDSSRIPIGVLVAIRKELCNHLILNLGKIVNCQKTGCYQEFVIEKK
jgi:hypothetical protein